MSRAKLLSLDALYSDRTTHQLNDIPSGNFSDTHILTRQYQADLGLTTPLAADWQLSTSASYGVNLTDYASVAPEFAISSIYDARNQIETLGAEADGSLFYSGGGLVKAAVGAELRRELYNYNVVEFLGPLTGPLSRHVAAEFAEVLLPLVGAENASRALQKLDLSLAVRHEDYSDFGATTNPKVGVTWSPLASLKAHATYGTAFQAPTLFDTSVQTSSTAAAYAIPDPTAAGGTTNALVLFGNRATLQAETAKTWTGGLDFASESDPRLSISVDYWDVRFKDRIGTPLGNADIFSTFENGALYASAITRNPPLPLVNQIFAEPNFFNVAGVTPAQIGAIIDDRLNNLARRNQSGLDSSFSYIRPLPVGTLNLQLAGSYILHIDTQATSASPFFDVVGTIYNPAKFRTRDSLGWSDRGFDLTAFVNYTKSYVDNTQMPPAAVSSWTTFDLAVTYNSAGTDVPSVVRDVRVSLFVQNLFDRNPPYVNQIYGLNFDPTNGSAIGRLINLQIVKAW